MRYWTHGWSVEYSPDIITTTLEELSPTKNRKKMLERLVENKQRNIQQKSTDKIYTLLEKRIRKLETVKQQNL